jgi:hypothetical protein
MTDSTGPHPILPDAARIVRRQRKNHPQRAAVTAKPGVRRKGKSGGFAKPSAIAEAVRHFGSKVDQTQI